MINRSLPLPDGAIHPVLRPSRPELDIFFSPRTVAVIGATETSGSVGRTILWNLVSSPFGGTVFPVNPKRASVLGIKAYPRIADVPAPVDLAVIVTPAITVPGVIAECVAAGVAGAIIISAGFKEIGPAGLELERQALAEARRGNMRLIGPNCLGVMHPLSGFNATFAGTIARPGHVGFISQSGALCTAILDWSLQENVGFSAFLSIGSMLDVGWGDLIAYLGDDPQTHSIVIYMESIGDARAFLSAAREVTRSKPIIILKAGHTEAAAAAAASHTGALAGSDAVLDAAFRRCGVLRVSDIAELFDMAQVLAKQPRPRGPRLTIVTNAGGPGVLATDALVESGATLTRLAEPTITALDAILPAHWSHGNPIDILGDATPERYRQALEIAAGDPNSDGLLVVLTPQAMTDPTQTAEQLRQLASLPGKPLLASWMGAADVAAGAAILARAGIPTFPYHDTAARAFQAMWRYSDNLRALYETPTLPSSDEGHTHNLGEVAQIIRAVREEGRTLLNEVESKQVLAAYGIPTVPTFIASEPDGAVRYAEQIGYPVVLKLFSKTITHKTDVGGVKLGLQHADDVRRAYREIEVAVQERAGAAHFQGVTVQPMIGGQGGYELIIGSHLDPQFGPVLLFGTGGQLVEVFGDRALALPPLTTTLARRMMERTRIYTALKGVRGQAPVDLQALELLLVRFSQLIIEQPEIKELDINPLRASADGLLALDARIIVHKPDVAHGQLPQPVIRPYPTQYVGAWTPRAGAAVMIRPIRPEDEPLMVAFHQELSERSVFFRYFAPIALSQRVAHERLTRMCFIDYDREMALVVEAHDPATGARAILGVGRLIKLHNDRVGEFAILVADRFQRQGLGSELLRRLVQIGRDEGLNWIVGTIHPENHGMQEVSKRLNFELRNVDGVVQAELALK
jgi:acetyltransferase